MKRIFPLGLIALGILLCLGAFVSFYLNSRAPNQSTNNLPQEVAGLPLTNSKSGKEAIAEFTSLHNEEFPVTSGAVGIYGNGAITLWVAVTSSDSIAAQLVSDMHSKISEGNSPFTPVKEIQNKNRNVYVLDGMGQKHYYFQSKDRVIWLAANRRLWIKLYNKSWRSIHEEITYVSHASLLSDSSGCLDAGLFL